MPVIVSVERVAISVAEWLKLGVSESRAVCGVVPLQMIGIPPVHILTLQLHVVCRRASSSQSTSAVATHSVARLPRSAAAHMFVLGGLCPISVYGRC